MNQTIKSQVDKLDRELLAMKQAAERAGREPTPEEWQRAQGILNEIDTLEAHLQTEARLENRPFMSESQHRPLKPEPMGGAARPPAPFKGGPAQDKTFRGMFPEVALSNGGFKSQDEFLEILSSGRHDPRLIRASFTEGTPSEGGFSVATEQTAQWLDTSLLQEVVRPRATVWPMTSATRQIPGWDMLDMTGGQCFGGLEIQWLPEEGTGTYQTGKLRRIELAAKKGAIFAQASNELVSDGLGFATQLERALIGSLTYGLDRAFLRGTGAGQPLGVMNAASTITVGKEAGQVADTIVYENLSQMWSRMYPAGRQRAVWVANDDCIPQLLQVVIMVGVGGVVYPVMHESDGQYYIFGRPVVFSPVMSTLGDLFDIALVDFSQYAIGLRKEMAIDRSQHVGFQKDMDTFRIIVRLDGQPTWNSVFNPEHGNSQSWAVTLAESA